MLIRARKWIRDTFEPSSRPPLSKVENWVKAGAISGVKIGGELFIEGDHSLREANEPEIEVKKPRRNLLN